MNKKTKIRRKPYLLSAFVSFAIVVLAYSVLDLFGIYEPIDAPRVFQILSICVTIVVLMWATDHIPFATGELTVLIDLVDIVVVLLVYNSIYHMFPFNLYYLLVALGIVAVSYFGAYALFVANMFRDERRINKQIQMAKQREEGRK